MVGKDQTSCLFDSDSTTRSALNELRKLKLDNLKMEYIFGELWVAGNVEDGLHLLESLLHS